MSQTEINKNQTNKETVKISKAELAAHVEDGKKKEES